MFKPNNLIKSKWVQATLLALLCVVVFCLVATTSNLFKVDELPLNIVAALLEAIITAVITVVLLKGQTEAEEVKERNVKVFEKKSELFEKYINLVWEVWKDRFLSAEEYENLISDYYSKLMIYLKQDSSKKIKESLIEIRNNVEKLNSTADDDEMLRKNIFSIINVLSKELGFDGYVDETGQKELEDCMFPILFRKTLLKMMDEIFVREAEIIQNGTYERHEEGGFEGEYICFKFNEEIFNDCKIFIGPFNNTKDNEDIYFGIFIETYIREVDEYRNGQRGWNRYLLGLKSSCSDEYPPCLNKQLRTESDSAQGNSFSEEIRLSFNDNINQYKGNFNTICTELANRAKTYFNEAKTRKDNLSIKEFMKKYRDLTK
ncbi:hypothetical protein LQZ19_01980 [Treponema primitia]|uniref:hypothetical protein n=1 Tax=Treponema primitia TaxID=88058 RepID=UPI00397E9549